MTWRTRNGLGGEAGRIVAAVLAALACWACGGPPELVPGVAVEGRLEPGKSASYRVETGAAEYLRVAVQPVGPGVLGGLDARVSDPRGAVLFEARGIRDLDGEGTADGALAWISARAGRHLVVIEDPASAEGLGYRVTLEERRPSRADDADRVAAQNARTEAYSKYGAGEIEAARAEFERELDHWRRVAGSAAAQARSLLDLAEIELAADSERALARCDEAKRVSAEAGLGTWRSKALSAEGRALRVRRDCAGALEAYREASEVALAEGDLFLAGNASFNLGRLHLTCSSGAEAEAAFRESIDIGRRAGKPGLEAVGHVELAKLAHRSLDLAATRDHFDRAWELVRDSDDDLEARADVLLERAAWARARGRLGEAHETFLRSLELNQLLGREAQVVRALLSLGSLALDLRRPEDARDFYGQALEKALALDDAATVSDAQHGLGAVAERSGDPVRAEELFRSALATAESLRAGTRRDGLEAAAKFRLGNLLLKEERNAEALPYLEEALALQEQAGDPRAQAMTRRALGSALARSGDPDAAAEQFAAALAAGREIEDPISIVWTLFSQASALVDSDLERARRILDEAIAIIEQVRAGLSVDTLRADFAEGPRRFFELYVELLVAEGDGRAAFLASERSRARALLDLLAEARIDLQAGVDPRLREEAREIDERMTWLRNELSAAAGAGAPGARETNLSRLLAEAEQDWWRVEAAIREASPRYREARAPALVGVEEVQADLPPGRALLEYWLGPERAYVFVVTRDSFTVVPLAVSPAEVVDGVEAIRSAILTLQRPERLAPLAHRLYREWVEPALAVTGGARELVVVPDGPLHLLPFEALVVSSPSPESGFEDLEYLGDRAVISYAPSATVLASLRNRRDGAGGESAASAPALRLVAFADPRYDRPLPFDCGPGPPDGSAPSGEGLRARSLERLRASRDEARAIAGSYGGGARIYQGAEASEATVKHSPEPAAAERLHFAVHGVVCEAFPERSGLVLSLDGDPAEDGFLQIREIFGLRLEADLVVLSACDSGTGRLVSGEGVVGLARAFFYAGAPSTVVSLWPVSDRSTAELMSTFYARLDAGDDKPTALQRARRELIAGGGRYAQPFYWAPFVLAGSREVRESG